METTPTKHRRAGWLIFLAVVLLVGWWWRVHPLALYDWVRLRGYTPPAAISALAGDDGLTADAQHIFYVNYPQLDPAAAFRPNCPKNTEKTAVLGCYKPNQRGIYLLSVNDPQLAGLTQVTAAHEMLHAAYDRLSSGERAKVNNMLESFYNSGQIDQSTKDLIDGYKQSEPGQEVNEMHSIFGTQLASLPAPLEQYYRRYFTNRAKVAAYYAAYNGVFTSRQQQVVDDDSQLKAWKSQIDNMDTQLDSQDQALNTQSAQMSALRAGRNYSAYNALVPGYNAQVNSYNSLIAQRKALADQYNQLVNERNQIALEENQLVQEISGQTPPAR